MNISTRPRVDKGVPAGGEFTAFGHSDKVPALGAPTVSDDFVTDRLAGLGFTGFMTDEEIARITAELNASRDFRDENITAVADRAHYDTAGHTVTDVIAANEGIRHLTRLGHEDEAAAIERLLASKAAVSAGVAAKPFAGAPEADIFSVPGTNTRLHVLRPEPVADGSTVPVPANDPRLLAGQVFDKVMAPDGTVFHRRREGVYPDWPNRIRVQASRPLREDEKLQMAGLLGYAYRAQVRGEGLSMPESDSPYSFIVGTDTTKTRSDDLGLALERFEEDLPTLFMEGSPARKTDRTGPIGSRLVEGLGDPDLTFELYYDDVSGD